jgi:hypothetical protein
MTTVALLALPAATALLLAASLRLPSLVSTLLAAYLALVGEVAVVTRALSPFDAVTRPGLAAACTALLAAALALWWARGRPGLPLAGARVAAAELVRDPITLAFGVVVALALAYELLLVLTVPPNNWDALAYHLPRVAAWAQEGGIEWIAHAPRDNLNEFPPLAEQQILFLFVAAGEGRLSALPQFLAQLAILVGVYGSARRLGFDARASAGAAFLLATFSLVALEATTAQTDLVAASFPVVAACLVLGGRRAELVLAGAALGLGLGAKLTTLFAWPVLAILVLRRGRRALLLAAAGFAGAVAAVSVWVFVLNAVHTGALLGHGSGRTEVTASPEFPGSLEKGMRLVFRSFDLSVLSNRTIAVLALCGLAAGLAAAAAARASGRRQAIGRGAAASIPLLAPLLVLAAAAALAFVTPGARSGDVSEGINRAAHEDFSAFGPIGTAALVVAIAWTVVAFARRRVGVDQLALALALPVAIVAIALWSTWNPYLTRFLLVAAVLTAPLLARFFVGRAVTASILAAATVAVALTLAENQTKPLEGRPWAFTRQAAVRQTWQPAAAGAAAALDRLVPARGCIGAVLDPDEPGYLLWDEGLERHVEFLPSPDAVNEAYRRGLFRVVVSGGRNAPVADGFEAAGWTVRPLGGYWLLAEAPGQGDACAAR